MHATSFNSKNILTLSIMQELYFNVKILLFGTLMTHQIIVNQVPHWFNMQKYSFHTKFHLIYQENASRPDPDQPGPNPDHPTRPGMNQSRLGRMLERCGARLGRCGARPLPAQLCFWTARPSFTPTAITSSFLNIFR